MTLDDLRLIADNDWRNVDSDSHEQSGSTISATRPSECGVGRQFVDLEDFGD